MFFCIQPGKFYTRQNYFTQALPVVPVTNIRYVHYQFFVDSAKVSNTRISERKCSVADRTLERFVPRVCLPVPESVTIKDDLDESIICQNYDPDKVLFVKMMKPFEEPILCEAHSTVLARIGFVQALLRHPGQIFYYRNIAFFCQKIHKDLASTSPARLARGTPGCGS